MSRNYELNPEFFAMQSRENELIFYAPLSGRVARVNNAMGNVLQRYVNGEKLSSDERGSALPFLRKNKFLVKKSEAEAFKKDQINSMNQAISSAYAPTSVTLMPTFDCTMRCVYCYSEGGEKVTGSMDFDVARSAIDLITENAYKKDQDSAQLSFHGGGEPFFPGTLDFVKNCVFYFQEQCKDYDLEPRISSATNGVINPNQLEWIVNNMDHLNISLDGPEDIQNLQRPLSKKKESYGHVMKTIAKLREIGFPFGIRATITDYSVLRMPEIIKFFHEIAPDNKSFHLESLFECGRCDALETNTNPSEKRAPSQAKFVEMSLKAREVAEKLGVTVHHSASEVEQLSNYFCGALGRNFFVTPDGYVTTCLEVCREGDADENAFFIGKYLAENGKFKFDQGKIDKLRERKVENIDKCTDCFAKYNCSGDCPAKVLHTSGDMTETG